MSAPYPSLEKGEDGLYINLPPYPPEDPPVYTPTDLSNTNLDRSQIEEELRKVEDEIVTLKTVLASKQERAAQLKRQLGLYGLDVARDDVKRATQAIVQSKPYVTVKDVVTKQWYNVTQTNAYKSVNSNVSSFFRSMKSSFTGQPTAAPTAPQRPTQPSAPPENPNSR
ncbi:hypothetical protein Aperf_G00000107942 [Anoplocephala perfoliata]